MNLIPAAPLWLILIAACAMIAAAVEDALRLRISNLTTLVVLAGAVVAAVLAGPTWALWQNVAAFAVLLVLGTLAFSAGWLGGGDVKLFAASGLWFGFPSSVWFVALVFVAGGIVAIGYLLSRPFRKAVPGQSKNAQVPYGIAIALGALAVGVIARGTFQHHPRPLPEIKIVPHRS